MEENRKPPYTLITDRDTDGCVGERAARRRREDIVERITVTSSELRDTSGDMRTAAESISDELTRMMSRVQALTSSWTGQAASSFDSYYQQMNTGWAQVREAMDGVAGMLDSAATSYDETEAGIAGQFSG